MKKFKFLLIFTLLIFAVKTNAHNISDSGTASLLIHIDPDDIAISQKPTTIHIDLRNSNNNFKLENCNCVFSIEQNEKELFSGILKPNKEKSIYNVEAVPFTFPNQGEYHINVKGSPLIGNMFNNFEVETNIEVSPVNTDMSIVNSISKKKHSHGTHPYIEFTEAFIFTLVMGYFFFSNNKSVAEFIMGRKINT